MADRITIEIDGQPFEADRGQMIIEVADRNGVRIPRFCYHHKLSIAANCRMCLVEVERAPKPMPACATPVMDGMKVRTRSPLALGAQKAVMEFLLVNHPLDCPICDQGGECELQDVAMGYGRDVSRFTERKRVVQDKDIGPLVATDMTRCIHCTRCVRFGEEIGGMPELGGTGRGEDLEIGTFIEHGLESEMSGNVIDLCPVGALTSKPFRFRARAWEMQQHDAVAPHDAVGSNVHVHVARRQVMRVVPRENEDINEVWLSDRDRFSYEGLYSDDRLTGPLVKRDGEWVAVPWEEALEVAVEGLRGAIAAGGGESLGVLASPSATLEELFLLQKLARGLGCPNIDHRVREQDFRDQDGAPAFPSLGMPIADLETRDAVLLVESNPRFEQPIVSHRLRKASLRGAAIMAVQSFAAPLNLTGAERIVVGPDRMANALAGIAAALGGARAAGTAGAQIAAANPDERERAVAARLEAGGAPAVLLGPSLSSHPDAALLRALAGAIAARCGAVCGSLSAGGNAAGAWLAGALPHRGPAGADVAAGLDAAAMLARPLPAYLLLGLEPELDCADGAAARAALEAAGLVVCLTAYRTAAMDSYADVMLPMALFAESPGTRVNAAGRWQSHGAVASPPGEARPAWRVLRVLGNLLDLEGFDYMDPGAVRDDLRALTGETGPLPQAWGVFEGEARIAPGTLCRVGTVPIYSIDPLVRRAPALQRTALAAFDGITVNGALAARLGLAAGEQAEVRQNGAALTLPVTVDERVADGCVLVPAGVPETAGLGPGFGPVEVRPA